MVDIKQCPFCASSLWEVDFWLSGAADSHKEYCIQCLNCGAQGPNNMTRELAIEMWNMRRAEFPKPYADNDEVVEKYEEE